VVIVLYALVDNKATIGHAELEEGEELEKQEESNMEKEKEEEEKRRRKNNRLHLGKLCALGFNNVMKQALLVK